MSFFVVISFNFDLIYHNSFIFNFIPGFLLWFILFLFETKRESFKENF